jgi:hypothetical protein
LLGSLIYVQPSRTEDSPYGNNTRTTHFTGNFGVTKIEKAKGIKQFSSVSVTAAAIGVT